jgi:hypothetical protein
MTFIDASDNDKSDGLTVSGHKETSLKKTDWANHKMH